jgi:hypothetical protein
MFGRVPRGRAYNSNNASMEHVDFGTRPGEPALAGHRENVVRRGGQGPRRGRCRVGSRSDALLRRGSTVGGTCPERQKAPALYPGLLIFTPRGIVAGCRYLRDVSGGTPARQPGSVRQHAAHTLYLTSGPSPLPAVLHGRLVLGCERAAQRTQSAWTAQRVAGRPRLPVSTWPTATTPSMERSRDGVTPRSAAVLGLRRSFATI